jgi:ABC-type lipoprotein release transport system permease subunit
MRKLWGLVWLEQLLRDLRYSLRMIRRSRGFASIVIATLAVGIGMTTAVFSVVNGVVLKALPYPSADRLIWIAPFDPKFRDDNSVSRADYLLWKQQAHSFEALAAYGNQDRALVYQNKTTTLQVASITGDFWSIAGAKPATGRLFGPQERDELVLSWAFFQERFGGNPEALEKTVTIDGRAFTLVGVLPKSFRFVFPPDMYEGDPIPEIEGYIPIPEGHEAPGDPIRETTETGPVPAWVRVVGRLQPDASFTTARAEMQVIYDRVRQIPNVFSRWPGENMRFVPLEERVVGQPRGAMMILFGAVGFVLLIAGANFASLLMARASTREREIAVRSALGASRGHLVRQFLVESTLLAFLGGTAGLLVAIWSIRVAKQIGAHFLPRLADAGIDVRVLLFTLAVSLMTGLLFGLAPGLKLQRDNVGETLKGEGATSSAGAGQLRFRRALVSVEFALAIVLLTGAGDAFAVRYVSTGFLRATGAPLVKGRWPKDEEWRDLKDLVLVNQTFARMYSGGSDILGKHIRGGVVDAIVIGVVADFKDFQLDAAPEPQVYEAYPEAPGMVTMRLFLRTESPRLIAEALPQLTTAIDPDVPVRIETLEQTLAESITLRRFNMYVFEVFAASALLLALIGIYGVLAYMVRQRTREIGIRMALGGQQGAIMRMVVWQGMRIALAGTALGMMAALGLTRLMASMLYETSAKDPITMAAVAAILLLTALLACWQPAWKAALTDPMVALRDQ